MNSSTLSSGTLGHPAGQRTSESQDTELTSSATQTSKILNQIKSELQEQKQRKRFFKELHVKRVQSLRKELDYLKATEWKYQSIDRVRNYLKDESETEDLNGIIYLIEEAKRKDKKTPKRNLSLNKEGCYYRTGKITQIAADYVIIDDDYFYEKDDALSNNLKLGDKVNYLAFIADPKAELKIRKILSLKNEETWDDETCNDETPKNVSVKPEDVIRASMMRRVIVTKVSKREGRIAIVEPYNIRIDLNKVQAEFIPLVGDWLKLEALVEVKENSVDLCGEILEVEKIKPLRTKLDIGRISEYNKKDGSGLISCRIVFHISLCEPGYIPFVGDQVVSESIESDQGYYTWRALTIVLLSKISVFCELPKANIFHSIVPNLNEIIKNKNGIVIDDKLEFNLEMEKESTLTVSIKNTSDCIQILQSGSFMSQDAPSQLSIVSPINSSNIEINPSESISYVFKCEPKFIGISEELFIFNFKDFKIARVFHITVTKTISPKTDFYSDIKKIHESYTKEVTQKNNPKRNVSYSDELNEITCIPGISPCKPPAFIQVRSKIFKVPRYMLNIAKIAISPKSEKEYINAVEKEIPYLLKQLRFETYKERFHTLLYLEEAAQRLEIQRYDIDNAIMRKSGEYLVLQVPGLTEKRPSLLIGDKAIAVFYLHTIEGTMKYEGYIHKITSSDIFLKFNQEVHQKHYMLECYVTFRCSQMTIQRCHQAIDLAMSNFGADFLFPFKVVEKKPQYYLECDTGEVPPSHDYHFKTNESISACKDTSDNDTRPDGTSSVLVTKTGIEQERKVISTKITEKYRECHITKINALEETVLNSCIKQIKKRKVNWINKNLNYYQKEAVKNILLGLARPLPYIIYGPPGTGKTMTLCEVILQIFILEPDSRLLIATPSNSSANLIAERLLDNNILKPGDLIRLIAHHCLGSDIIPEKLLPYCATADLAAEGTRENPKYNGEGPRLNCTKSILGRQRIIVGTCSALGILYNIGLPRGHFSHVIVDEAGQATEPEILIPINFICPSSGQIILAGDPMQLGPVVYSKIAKYFGFDDSFLVRLLRQFPYHKDLDGFKSYYDPRLVTKLLMNYRSLPEILNIANTLIYQSQLQPQISPSQSKEAKLLEMLRAELPERDGHPPAIVFHGVNGKDYRDAESPSWYNSDEAIQVYLYLVKLYKYGLEPDDIGIITPYQKQVLQIRDLLSELDVKQPKISSVEGFQGQERKIIIISVVRSCTDLVKEDIKYNLGFISSPRRFNVAITRARALVIIIGNPNLLIKDEYWGNVLTYCITHKAYTGCNFVLGMQ